MIASRRMEARLDVARSVVGAPIANGDAVQLAARMQLPATLHEAESAESNAATIEVDVPPTRSDIMHECDIIEGENDLQTTALLCERVGDGEGCECVYVCAGV
jgi:phenylalanyl-tRNA synthetase beta subunit